MCPLQLGITIEYIRRHVCRKSFIVTAYQHDDDEFVSKCNYHQNKLIEQVYCFHMFIYIKGKIAEIIRAPV